MYEKTRAIGKPLSTGLPSRVRNKGVIGAAANAPLRQMSLTHELAQKQKHNQVHIHI